MNLIFKLTNCLFIYFLYKDGLPDVHGEKTTMIILCDDGSLKIYVADAEKTEYWLQPHLRATHAISQLRSSATWSATSLFQLCPTSIFDSINRPHKTAESDKHVLPLPNVAKELPVDSKRDQDNSMRPLKRSNAIKSKSSSSKSANKADAPLAQPLSFPIDYFEKCSQFNDVEYGGNDLLEVYNQQQLKSRLSMGGNKFVCSTKPTGFKLEILNKADAVNSLLMGCRILCGTHSLERVPLYFEVLGRRIPVKLARQRWFDICLTREEALLADNKLVLHVGCSADTRHITAIDGCVCYIKSKESLNWSLAETQSLQKQFHAAKSKEFLSSCDTPQYPPQPQTNLIPKTKTETKKTAAVVTTSHQIESNPLVQYEPKAFDCLLGQSLDILENSIILLRNEANLFPYSISTSLLSLICPPVITFKAKSLLHNILWLSSTTADSSPLSVAMLYNGYNDDAVLSLVAATFQLKSLKISAGLSGYFSSLNSYLDQIYDLETLEKTLLVCKSLIQQQRANNLIKYLNDKFNVATNGHKHFISALNSLFWRVINRSMSSVRPIGQPEISNLNMIIESLVEVMHYYLLVELTMAGENNLETFAHSKVVNLVVECYMKLLCNDLSLDISFGTRKILLALLKSPVVTVKSKALVTQQQPVAKQTPHVTQQFASKLKFILQPPMPQQSTLTISELSSEPGSFFMLSMFFMGF